jgi:hypothetical protein
MKVWGPKKNDAAQSIRHKSKVDQTLLPAHLSSIVDSDLSDRDLYLLRILHRTLSTKDFDLYIPYDVILVHLFDEYGATFPDKTLLYATLAFSSGRCLDAGFLDAEYWEYISRFQKSMLYAIRKDSISECHLFAIYLVLEGRYEHDRDFEVSHKQGFATIFRKLVAATPRGATAFQGAPKLTFLWHYCLSTLCRKELTSLHHGCRNWVWELHDAAEELRFPAILPNDRFPKKLSPLFWEDNIGNPDWASLMSALMNDRAILRVCVARLLCGNAGEHRTISKVAKSIAFVKRRLNAMRNVEYVRRLVCEVHVKGADGN